MKIINQLKYGILLGCTIVLFACGGGGSGASAPAYTGKVTQAVVDNSNSKDFSDTTYTGSGATGAFASLEAGKSNGANLKDFARTFRAFSKGFDVSKGTDSAATAEVVNLNESIPGECGGSYAFNINYDTETGSFDGSLTFNNFDDCEGTVNGSVNYSGTLEFGDIIDFTMTFSSLSFNDDTTSVTMNGSAVFSQISNSEDQVVLNLDYKDNNTNVTYRTENLVINTTYYNTHTSETMTGKVYHPDYGYVVVTTSSPIIVYLTDYYPSEGVVVMTGAAGKATVTFNHKNSYTITVDVDGDGSIDETKACTWEPDACETQ